MLKYLAGEIFRIAHKKSLYVYFASVAVFYLIISFVRSGGFGPQSAVSDAFLFFGYLPVIAGGFMFQAVYADDLNSKNLATLIGFSLGKVKIVTAKLALTVLFCAAVYSAAPLIICAAHAAFGHAAGTGGLRMIYSLSLKYLLATVGCSALAATAVYGTQKPTFAFVLYILLALNIIGGLVTLLVSGTLGAGAASFVAGRLFSGVTDRILEGVTGGQNPARAAVEYLAYVAVASAASIAAFMKKETEL